MIHKQPHCWSCCKTSQRQKLIMFCKHGDMLAHSKMPQKKSDLVHSLWQDADMHWVSCQRVLMLLCLHLCSWLLLKLALQLTVLSAPDTNINRTSVCNTDGRTHPKAKHVWNILSKGDGRRIVNLSLHSFTRTTCVLNVNTVQIPAVAHTRQRSLSWCTTRSLAFILHGNLYCSIMTFLCVVKRRGWR